MYSLLFNSVSKTLKQLSRDRKYLGAGQIGFISVLHTWSQTLLDHPHIHAIVTGGGLSKNKTRWIRCKKDFFIKVHVLSQRFRNIFITGLEELYKNYRLDFHGRIQAYKWKTGFRRLKDKLYRKSWVVQSEANYSDAVHIFDYLGRYVRKVAIDNHRIIKVEHDRVYFPYKDYADKNKKKKVIDLDVYEFMRRYLLHVLPHRFVKIRYYGLLGHKDRKKKLSLCRKLLDVKEGSREKEIPETWKELYEYVTGHEVSRCPYCKEGTLVYVQEILPRLPAARGP